MMNNFGVGPIINSGPWLEGLLKALKESNPVLEIIDRGSYCRASSPMRCVLTHEAFSKHLNDALCWPEFLEHVMPSFQGKLSITNEKVEWLEN